jgi:septal ring-binding cell division protein DamX
VGPSAKKSGEAGAQKPAAAASPAVTKKGERWSLQFGYYANRENAETFLKRFPDDRFLIMEEKQADGTVRWRVLYGDFATKEEALEAEKELQCRAEVLKRQAEEWEKLYEDWKKGNAPFPVTKP